MGSVSIKDTVERAGDVSSTSVEYNFEDYKDFIDWQERKDNGLKSVLSEIFSNTGAVQTGEDFSDLPAPGDFFPTGKKKEPIKH